MTAASGARKRPARAAGAARRKKGCAGSIAGALVRPAPPAARRRRLAKKTEAELRAAYHAALSRLEDLAEELRGREGGIGGDDLYKWRDAIDDARENAIIAREDLEDAGYSLRPPARAGRREARR